MPEHTLKNDKYNGFDLVYALMEGAPNPRDVNKLTGG